MTIKLNRYEYEQKNCNGEHYVCGYTIKEGVKPLDKKHKLVDTFTIERKEN